MRPVVAQYLKCTKCNSVKMPRILQRVTESVALPPVCPSLEAYRTDADYLIDLANTFSEQRNLPIEVGEADVYEFLESSNSPAITELLCGLDVKEGCICCRECGDEKSIRESILYISPVNYN